MATLSNNSETLAITEIVVSMLARFQKIDPALRVLVSLILEEAAQQVEQQARSGDDGPRYIATLMKLEEIQQRLASLADVQPAESPSRLQLQ